jgi:hypothetical protein
MAIPIPHEAQTGRVTPSFRPLRFWFRVNCKKGEYRPGQVILSRDLLLLESWTGSRLIQVQIHMENAQAAVLLVFLSIGDLAGVIEL